MQTNGLAKGLTKKSCFRCRTISVCFSGSHCWDWGWQATELFEMTATIETSKLIASSWFLHFCVVLIFSILKFGRDRRRIFGKTHCWWLVDTESSVSKFSNWKQHQTICAKKLIQKLILSSKRLSQNLFTNSFCSDIPALKSSWNRLKIVLKLLSS